MKDLPLRVFSKSLFLLVLPLLLQIALLVVVFLCIKDYSNSIDQELRMREIPVRVQELSASLAECATFAKVEPVDKEEFDHRKKVVEAQLDNLRKLCSFDPLEKKKFDEVDAPVKADLAALSGETPTKSPAKSDDSASTSSGFGDEDATGISGDSLGSAFEPLDQMLTTELANMDFRKSANTQQFRLRQQSLVVLAASLLLSLGLMYFYYRSVVRRFDVLRSNLKRLTTREALLTPISGTDEIAMVDGVLHDLSLEIQASDQQKRQLLTLVRQGMRDPLNNAYLILHKLTENNEDNQYSLPLRQKLLHVERQTDSILKTVTTLLDIQAIEAGKFEMTQGQASAAEIIDSALVAVDDIAAGRGVMIKFAPPAVKIVGDAGRLSQVMQHLLTNAIRNSMQGGTVVVDVLEEDNFVEFRVTDETYGALAMTQSKLIEDLKFGQGDTLAHGTGMLGLAMCKAIVEQHGGTLGIEGSEREGTSVYFRLPMQGEGR